MPLFKLDDTPVFDNLANAVKVIDYDHHEIHGGSAFSCKHYDADLDNGDTLNLSFLVPASTGKRIHLVASGSNSSAALFELLEGPTITAESGTQTAVFNRDRNSAKESIITDIDGVANKMTEDATLTADGTAIETVPLAAGKSKVVDATRGISEWLLKSATAYTLRITGAADNGVATLHLDWYEHTSVAKPMGI